MLRDIVALTALLLATTTGTSELTGRVRASHGVAMPREMSVRFTPPNATESLTVSCPVGGDGRWSCSLPAATIDLRIEASGAAPQYLWGIDLTAHSSVDVGEVVLSSGASIAGWVSSDERDFDPRETTVRLAALSVGNARDVLPRYTAVTKPNTRGFFQFTGVPEGAYSVLADKRGLSPTQSTLVVHDPREYVVDTPLRLRPLARVFMSVTPPLDPSGEPWLVKLDRHIPMSTGKVHVAKSAASKDGEWETSGVEAGTHYLELIDSHGTVFERQQLEVEAEMPPIAITIFAVPVKGRVLAGDKPVRAKVKLWTPSSGGSAIETDEDGHFECLLAREGTWRVDLKLLDSEQTLNAKPVVVRRRDTEEHARIEIKLPGGRVRGRVVDENGEGVKAGVLYTQAHIPLTETWSSKDGYFELVGLEEGPAVVEANTRSAESGTVPLMISDSSEPNVTLTLRPLRKLEAWLTTRSGNPVVGAKLLYSSPLFGLPRPAVSSPSGRFTIIVPKNATAVDLVVMAPGLPAKLSTIALPSDDSSVRVVVSELSGRLLIRYRGNGFPFVRRDGVVASLIALLERDFDGQPSWATPDGIALDVEPGVYSVCPRLSNTDDCVTRTVAVGATVLIDGTRWPEVRLR